MEPIAPELQRSSSGYVRRCRLRELSYHVRLANHDVLQLEPIFERINYISVEKDVPFAWGMSLI